MSETLNSSLKTAVKGTALIFAGMAGGVLLVFAIKIVIIRSITLEELGLYTLTVTVGSVLSVLASLGTQEGVTRHVSNFLGQGCREEADAVSRASLHVGIVLSLAVSLLLYVLSGFAARHVFYMPEIASPLRVIAFYIPFFVMTGIMSSILRGHGIVRPKVYYQDIGQPLYFLAILDVLLIFGFGLSYINLLYAFTASAVLAFISISCYGYKKLGLSPLPRREGRHYRELLGFSFPLMVSGVMGMVIDWTDTLLLGRYTTASEVGIYSVSISLARFLLFFISALSFIFLPLAVEMHSKGRLAELKRTYQVLTKWIFSATLPIFFVFFFFPEMTIAFLFGERLLDAALPLRILSLGFLFHVFLGTNDSLLIVKGRTRAIMAISSLMAFLNVVLNYVFIKQLGYGVTGAASASCITYLSGNAAISLVIYRYDRIHPFTTRYLRPIASTAVIGLIIYALSKILPFRLWMVPVYFLLFVGGYIFSLLVTGSLDKEDVFLFEAIKEKTGLEMRLISRIIHR